MRFFPPRSAVPGILAILFVGLASSNTDAQQQGFQPSVTATPLSNRVAIGEIGVLMIKVNGGNARVPETISVEGLEVAQTGRESNIAIQNGVRTMQTIYSYRFRGNEPGTYTIPSIQVQVGNSTIATKPVTITIFERNEDEAIDATRPLFAKLELPKKEFYTNELIPFTVTAYVRGRNSLRDIGPVVFKHENLITSGFEKTNGSGGEIGSTYYSSVAIPSTLFALKPGSFRIGPATVGLRLLDEASGFGFPSFFTRTVAREISTNTVNINVKSLPNNAPISFTGGVGSFKLATVASITDVSIGDPISMKFVVTGKGNLQTMEAPVFSIPQTGIWKTYDPSKTLEKERDSDGFSEGVVEFSRVIIPEAKVDNIPTFELAYFDPDKGEYVTLKSEPIPVTIRADATAAPVVERPRVSNMPMDNDTSFSAASRPTAQHEDILHIRTASPRWIAASEVGKHGIEFYLVQILFSAAFFTILGFGAVRWWKLREQNESISALTFRKAVKKLPGPGSNRRGFFQYVLEAIEIWHEENPDAPDKLRDIVSEVSDRCGAVLYSGKTQTDAPVSRDEASEYRSILERLLQS